MTKDSKPFIVSVFIPVYNGEKYLAECIQAVLDQKLPPHAKLELLITDSTSSDKSVGIIESFKDPRIVFNQIPTSEFGHGKTRQQAAINAKGDFILFLTQDATPASDQWLRYMIEPFYINEKVGIVFGRQIPRPLSVPTIKREVAGVFAGIGAPDSITLQRSKSLIDGHKTNEANDFFSDVNSAARRELLIGKIPFRDIPYSEDQALAQDMNKAGYIKAYSPQGAVWHSNEYSVSEFAERKYDEYRGLQDSIGYVVPTSPLDLLTAWIKPSIRDWQFTLRDGEYGRKTKLKYLVLAPLYNLSVVRGRYNAYREYKKA